MARTKRIVSASETTRSRPALTPEARENQMIHLAVNVAEKQLREGTASPQVITHYLKLGTEKSKLEIEKLRQENEMIKAKTAALQSTKRIEELYSEAITAMRSYAGLESTETNNESEQ